MTSALIGLQLTKIELEVYDDCSICTEQISVERAFMVTTCCHVIHADCMLTWCLNQPTHRKTLPGMMSTLYVAQKIQK